MKILLEALTAGFFTSALAIIPLVAIAGEKGAVREGQKAPDFQLKDQHNKPHRLRDYLGKKHVVLYFYPKDDTPGCTKEACSFRDERAVFDSLETAILGISVDDAASHAQFASKYNLNFPILSDVNKEVCRKYGTLSPSGMAKRMTFVIDKNGTIRKIYHEVDVDRHSAEVAEFIRENLLNPSGHS